MKNLLILIFFSTALIACENEKTDANKANPEHSNDTVAETITKEFLKEDIAEVSKEKEKEDEIPQGKFEYEIFQAEYGGRVDNEPCTVEITGNRIIVTQNKITGPKGMTTIFNGQILKHKSGKWILTNNEADINEDDIGGCTGINVIYFEKKLIEMC